MSLVEVIGFIITLLSIIFIFFKQRYDALHPKKRDRVQLIEEEEEDPLEQLLRGFGVPLKRQPPKAPPPPPQKQMQKPQKQQRKRSYKDDHQWKALATPDKIKIPVDEHDHVSKSTISHEKRSAALHIPFEEGYPSRAKVVLLQLSHPSHLIIYQELMGKPKSLRTDDWP